MLYTVVTLISTLVFGTRFRYLLLEPVYRARFRHLFFRHHLFSTLVSDACFRQFLFRSISEVPKRINTRLFPHTLDRSTHFFGGGAAAPAPSGGAARASQSPPPPAATTRRGVGADDGGLADFLTSSGPAPNQSAQGRAAGGAGAAGDGSDRYGLFSTTSGAAPTRSRVSQSRDRYDTLFGEEVRAPDA